MVLHLQRWYVYLSSRCFLDSTRSVPNVFTLLVRLDLALSVTMTAISTVLAVVMLPLNLYMYTPLIFNKEDIEVTEILDFGALITSLCVVFGAIGLGIFASSKVHNHNFHIFANRVSLNTQWSEFPRERNLSLCSYFYDTAWQLRGTIPCHPLRRRFQCYRRSSNLGARRKILLWSRIAVRQCSRHLQLDDYVRWSSEEARARDFLYRVLLPKLWYCHFGCSLYVQR